MTQRTIYDPPAEVWVLSYTWHRRNARSGIRELFLNRREVEHRLHRLYNDDDARIEKPAVLRLQPDGTWQQVEISPPQDVSLIDGDVTDDG